MTNNNKAILEHIDKIEQFARKPENGWLLSELERRFGGKQTQNDAIQRVEKYLGLDYELDSAKTLIDYSYVADNYVRNQLESDYREMLRYRYGLRSHKVDFDEFCRYVHLQAEALSNYYYLVACGDIANIKQRILQYNPQANVSKNTVESISYAYKLKAIIAELFPPRKKKSWFSGAGQTIFNMLDWVKDVRNTQSHRGEEKDLLEFVKDYEERAIENGLPWNANYKNFDFTLISQSVAYTDIYETYFKEGQEKYKYGLWYIDKPFDDIIKAVRDFSIAIKNRIYNTW